MTIDSSNFLAGASGSDERDHSGTKSDGGYSDAANLRAGLSVGCVRAGGPSHLK